MSDISKFAKLKTASDEELREAAEELEEEKARRLAENDLPDGIADLADDLGFGNSDPLSAAKTEVPAEPEIDFETGDFVKIDVVMKTEDMFRFFMRHTYYSASGIFGLAVGVGAIALIISGLMKDNIFGIVMLCVIAAMYTIVNPVTNYMRAKKQVKEMNLSGEPYVYTFGDAGIKVQQGAQYVPLKWAQVIKGREGKTSYYLYLGTNRAFVLPKECMGEERQHFVDIVTKNAPEGRIKFKTV